jgi:hypothetical protein
MEYAALRLFEQLKREKLAYSSYAALLKPLRRASLRAYGTLWKKPLLSVLVGVMLRQRYRRPSSYCERTLFFYIYSRLFVAFRG